MKVQVLPVPTVKLGQDVVHDGRLVQLATRLQFSMSQMSELIGVSLTTYVRWVKYPRTVLSQKTAERLGLMYHAAVQEIRWLHEDGVKIDTLVPFYRVATRLGWPHEYLLAKHRSGEIPGYDVGVLGLWMDMPTYTKLILAQKRRNRVASQ